MSLATIDPHTLLYAILGGIIPTLGWMVYWNLQIHHHEGRGMMALAFLMGALAVLVVIPIQTAINTAFGTQFPDETLFAIVLVEEFFKFFLMRLVVLRLKYVYYRSDYVMYMIASALGFAALENTLYLITPLAGGDFAGAFQTGNLRFFGATVTHTVSSAIHGLWVGLFIDQGLAARVIGWTIGLVSATTLHGVFNYFIIHEDVRITIVTLIVLWTMLMIITRVFHRSEVLVKNPQ